MKSFLKVKSAFQIFLFDKVDGLAQVSLRVKTELTGFLDFTSWFSRKRSENQIMQIATHTFPVTSASSTSNISFNVGFTRESLITNYLGSCVI